MQLQVVRPDAVDITGDPYFPDLTGGFPVSIVNSFSGLSPGFRVAVYRNVSPMTSIHLCNVFLHRWVRILPSPYTMGSFQ